MICWDDECDRPARKLGLCTKHYDRFRKHGDTKTVLKGAPPRVPKRPCSIEDCDNIAKNRGWCPKHYSRWRTYGDPMVTSRVVSTAGPLATFLANVEQRGPDECWPWMRKPSRVGYGYIAWFNRKVWYVHRVAYVLAYGEIPGSDDEGDPIEIDHLCHDPAVCKLTTSCPHRLCCNPAHLEAKKRSANTGRTTFWSPCPEGCACGKHRGGAGRRRRSAA